MALTRSTDRRWRFGAGLSLLLVSCASEAGPPPPDPLGEQVARHVRVLASDELAGRAPGTPGGEGAAAYLEEQLRRIGVAPAGSEGFRQPVPLQAVRTLEETRVEWQGARRAAPLAVEWSAFLGGWNRPVERWQLEAPAVFVGYGIVAEEGERDDMRGAQLRGKWAVALDGAPADLAEELIPASQPAAKLLAAARHGAGGLVLLSSAPEWPEPYELAREERTLPGWGAGEQGQPIPSFALRGPVVDSLSGGENLWQEALSPGFRARPLAGTLRAELVQSMRRFESPNLVARLEGSDRELAAEHVCLSAHYDGLGRSPRGIYRGVVDNAMGVGELLEVAALAARSTPPRRSLLFLFTTAEEAGLLGSQYFVEHPTIALEKLVGCLNKDGASEAWGRSTDLVAVAAEASPPFAAALREGAARAGLAWSANPFASEGFFFRSDHYSFLRAGVPGALIFLGLAFEGQPPAWGLEQAAAYLRQHYHRTSDDLSRVLGWDGAAQYVRVWLELARGLADGPGVPREEIRLAPGA